MCGAQVCATACGAAQEGGPAGCGAGLTCCSLHCVDTSSEAVHCGACGNTCAAGDFCGTSGCLDVRLSSLCAISKVVVVLDGQNGDDPQGRAMAQSLVSSCVPAPVQREVSQTVADALNPSNGRPVTGGDQLLVIAGGNYFQHAAGYLLQHQVAPISNVQNGDKYEIRHTQSGALIASEFPGDPNHDVFVVQFMRDASTSSLILNAYGSSSEGTAAAAFYFGQVLVPDLTHATKRWYVVDWTDKNGDQLPNMDEFALIEAGE